MQSTTNYQLVKQELTDRADITQISGNWDKIDTQLKKLSDEKFDKTGGTITGKTTISKDGLSVTGGTTTDTLTANGKVTAKGGVDVTGTLTASGKITGSGGLAVTGGTSTDTLTTSGAATVAGKLTAKNGLDVTGAVTLQNVTASTLTANTFQALDQNAFRSRANVKRGTNPSAIVYSHWSIFDNAGWGIDANRLGRVQYSVNTDGTATIGMYVNKFSTVGSEEVNGIAIQWLADGTARVSLTHHPQAGSNDKQIATTNWVRSLTATTSEYGLVKLADETALLSEADDATLTVDASYELNDFRRMSTAYTLGDKVNCAFNFGVFLECTQAGTTSAETLDTRSVTHGQVISDGTVQWTVRTHVKSINGNVPDASGNVSIDTAPPIATTEEAKAGTDDTKMMTPLKTRQAIDKFAIKSVNEEEPDENGNVNVSALHIIPLIDTDANTVKTPGLYDCYTTYGVMLGSLNFPNDAWGKLLVTEVQNYIIQEFTPDRIDSNNLPLSYQRVFNKSNPEDNKTAVGNWSYWKYETLDGIVGFESYNYENTNGQCRRFESGLMIMNGLGKFEQGTNKVWVQLPYPAINEPYVVACPIWDNARDIPILARGGVATGTNNLGFNVYQRGSTEVTFFIWHGIGWWK